MSRRLQDLRRLAAVGASGLALTACVVGPDYRAPAIAAPSSYAEAGAAPPLAVTPAGAVDSDLEAWWTTFNDPTLNDLIARALADNLDLQAAESRVREARLQVRSTQAAELPSLTATADAVTFNSDRPASGALPIPGHINLYSVGFDASWELDLFGGTRRSIEEAKASAAAAEWTRRDATVSLLAEVANDYLTLRALQLRIALGQAELQRQQDLQGLVQSRRTSGFVTNQDVNQQSAQVSAAAAQIPQLEAEARVQIHALGVLLGRPPGALATELEAGDTPLPPPSAALPLGLPSDLLRRRPDIRAAERRLAAASAEIGVQEANRYPKVNLLGLASLAGTALGGLFAQQNLSSAGVGAVSLPIFDGGRIRAQIGTAKEEKTQALIAYRTTVLGAFRDVEDALARYRADDRRRTALAASVMAAGNNLTIAQDQRRVGLFNAANALQAEAVLLNSRDQLAQADAQRLSDLVSLYKALGGGWTR
ncbi:MAG: Efflux transporter, outer rane factor lipoprotein NodT family [Phenylobacterium sp.]|nr:Efflux transporter, outer rane factor lipoprotein NodT family [Phenylobacterium sp.]